MVGEVRHFEIPYVKAYLAMRFHRTVFSWKANDIGRKVATVDPAATFSANDIDETLEQVRHEDGVEPLASRMLWAMLSGSAKAQCPSAWPTRFPVGPSSAISP
jgi:hypothetical protein